MPQGKRRQERSAQESGGMRNSETTKGREETVEGPGVVGADEKGSLESETVKYGLEFQGTRTQERLRWQGPAAYTNDRLILSSERAPHKNKTVNVKQ
jgi:hypothetical protein